MQNAGKGEQLMAFIRCYQPIARWPCLLVILFWMRRRKISLWFILIPAVFMLLLPGMAMSIELFKDGG